MVRKYKYEFLVAIMCLIYAVIAFVNLGDTTSPQSGYRLAAGESIILDFSGKTDIYRLAVFNGAKPADSMKIEISDDGINFEETAEIKSLSVFAWHTADIDRNTSYIRLSCGNFEADIKEVALFNKKETRISYSTDKTAICDEQDIAVCSVSYKNSTYFDEIYHARTAWEYTHGIKAYEWTHPPLGKLIISIGTGLFGMTPFGWRFMGTFLGIIMIWLMYLLALEVFGSKKAGVAAAFLMMFDFMHFTQTRIATIDTYAVFFIILMYLFMFKFVKENDNRKSLIYLFWCGLFFGLGVASKWTCVYAGAGLAIIFVINIFGKWKKRNEIEEFWGNTVRIVLLCVVFFIIIPALIYWVSYIPYAFTEKEPHSVYDIFEIQKNMFDYHSKLEATHSFGSKWYQWPVMYKPIWYFYEEMPEKGLVLSISAFGNPAVWWVSIPATAIMLWFMLKERKFKTAGLILIGYLAQYLPWVGVTRVVFIYHYFTSVPFIILIIVYSAMNMKSYLNPKLFTAAAAVYAVAVIGLFIMFYPVISGYEVSGNYIKNVLTWFSTWHFGG